MVCQKSERDYHYLYIYFVQLKASYRRCPLLGFEYRNSKILFYRVFSDLPHALQLLSGHITRVASAHATRGSTETPYALFIPRVSGGVEMRAILVVLCLFFRLRSLGAPYPVRECCFPTSTWPLERTCCMVFRDPCRSRGYYESTSVSYNMAGDSRPKSMQEFGDCKNDGSKEERGHCCW